MSLKKEGPYQYEKKLCPISSFDSLDKLDIPRLMLARKGIQQEIVLISIADILADFVTERNDFDPGIYQWGDIFTSKEFWRMVYCRSFHILEVALGKSVPLLEGPIARPKGWRSIRFKVIPEERQNFIPGIEAGFLKDDYLKNPKFATYASDYLKKLKDTKYIGQKGYIAVFLLKLYESLPVRKHKFDAVLPKDAFQAALAVLSQVDEYRRPHWHYYIQLPTELADVFENSKPYITKEEFMVQEAIKYNDNKEFRIFDNTLQCGPNLIVNRGAVGSYRSSKSGIDNISSRVSSAKDVGDCKSITSVEPKTKKKNKLVCSAHKSNMGFNNEDELFGIDELNPLALFREQVDKTMSNISSIEKDKERLLKDKQLFDQEVDKKISKLDYKIKTETESYKRKQGTLDVTCVKLNIGDRITDLLMDFSGDVRNPESHLIPVLQNFEQMISCDSKVRDFFIEMTKKAWNEHLHSTQPGTDYLETCNAGTETENFCDNIQVGCNQDQKNIIDSPALSNKTTITIVNSDRTKNLKEPFDMTRQKDECELLQPMTLEPAAHAISKTAQQDIEHLNVAWNQTNYLEEKTPRRLRKIPKLSKTKLKRNERPSDIDLRDATRAHFKKLRQKDTGKTQVPAPSKTSLSSFTVVPHDMKGSVRTKSPDSKTVELPGSNGKCSEGNVAESQSSDFIAQTDATSEMLSSDFTGSNILTTAISEVLEDTIETTNFGMDFCISEENRFGNISQTSSEKLNDESEFTKVLDVVFTKAAYGDTLPTID